MRRSTSAAGLLAAVGLALVAVLVGAAPASAHTRTQQTTNLDSRITADPRLAGVSWTVHTGGLLVEVVNTSEEVLVVEGYEGEPYLRVGPAGVEHNVRSPATYLNDERVAGRVGSRTDVAMPPDVDADAPAEWARVADEPRALWHDHRVHWMSPSPPGFVSAGPLSRTLMRVNLVGVIGRAGDDAGVFREWEIPVHHGGGATVLGGELAWVDAPSPAPWLLFAGLLVSPALVGLRRREAASVLRPAALMLIAVAAVNLVHLADDLWAWPGPALDELSGLLHTAIFLTAGLGAAVWAWRVDSGRVLALAIGSAALLYHQGIVQLPMLFASQYPTMWPPALIRLTVALGVVQAVPVLLAIRRARALERPETARVAGSGPHERSDVG